MQYVKITPNLFLTQQRVEKDSPAAKPVKKAKNNIWIYDRSGSMNSVIRQLCKDLIEKAKTIPAGDTLTLGWFSSEGGEFDFMLKGFKITEKADYAVVENIINKNSHTIGCTCFSEILADTEKVIKDLSAISEDFAVCFFTDGYPVVSNYTKEIEKINSAISKIEGKVSSSMLVGYGNYYNKTLMMDMAQRFGGALIHSEDLSAFNTALSDFITDSRNNEGKIEVELPDMKGSSTRHAIFGINGNQITNYKSEGGKVSFVPTQAEEDYVYWLSDFTILGSEEVKFTDSNVKGKNKDVEPMVRAAYAAAYILTQTTKTDKALEVLACLGDKALIDGVNNAFTNTEYGAAEEKIKTSMLEPTKRFGEGRNTKYLPSADAFCLLDVLDLLGSDDEAKFFPYHDSFKYERIGTTSSQKTGYGKFTGNKNSNCSVNDFVWHGSMLNLSVRATIDGTVNLQGDFKKNGFAENYPCKIFRSYNLVKDGFLNTKEFPATLSSSTFKTLKANGVIDEGTYKAGQVYVLHLNRVPVINRSIADGKTSATELCKKCFEEISLKAKMKAFGYYQDQLEAQNVREDGSSLTAEQEAYLEGNGIKKGIFNPPSDKGDATDHYFAKEFDIKIKDHSSLPKVEEVIVARTGKKALTPTKALVASGVELFEKNTVGADAKKKLAAVKSLISQHKAELRTVRTDIQKTKFAVILGKRWFDEFTSREDNKLTVDGREFTISVREVKVEV